MKYVGGGYEYPHQEHSAIGDLVAIIFFGLLFVGMLVKAGF